MLYDSKLWIADIDRVLTTIPEIDNLAGKSVLITGAAGLVCSSVVDMLFRYNDLHEKKIKILAAGRWHKEMYGRFHEMVDNLGLTKYDDKHYSDVEVDDIIHRFMSRKYGKNGVGNIFWVGQKSGPLFKNLEIWDQMQAYVLEKYGI